jgi:hypothetical protein
MARGVQALEGRRRIRPLGHDLPAWRRSSDLARRIGRAGLRLDEREVDIRSAV